MVVEVVSNALTVGDQRLIPCLLTAFGQFERNHGVIGEVSHQLEMACIEGSLAIIPGDGEDA